MKSSPKSARLTTLGILLAVAALLPLTMTKPTGASSTSTFRTQPNEIALEPSAYLFAAYTVNDLGDTGAGTGTTGDLRYCITQANAAGGTNTINFSVTGTITLLSALPTITNNLTIDGPGAGQLTVSGNNTVRVFVVGFGSSSATFSNLTVAEGNAGGLQFGAGIYNTAPGTVNVSNCVVRNCSALIGAGIYNEDSGTINVTDSTIRNNSVTNSGGGFYNNVNGTINIIGCTVNNNSAPQGGGMYNNDNSGSRINITSSTFSGNNGGGFGGGLATIAGINTITHCTFTGNAATQGGGIAKGAPGVVNIKNTLVAQNTATTGPDLLGGFTSQGYNLIGIIGSATGLNQTGDQTGTGGSPLNPQLVALANNGGPTATHALLAGSPAIDKGKSFGSTTDQRGFSRIFDDATIPIATGGDNTDIGAFELGAAAPSPLGNYPNTAVALSANATVTPDAAPAGATGISVSTATTFKGTLTASPSTGVVRVTNANPAGTYTVTVKAFSASGMTTRTFTLTVQSGTPCASVAYVNAPNVPISSFPTSVALGDFNEDGKQDFVTGYDSFDPASVRFGDGAGGFTGMTTVNAAPFIRSIAVGDFNEDGHQDLALSNNSVVRSVSIRLGDGTGGFSGTLNVPVGALPASVAIGDFNGDGHQDLATADSIDNTVSIRLGDGAGSFSGTTEIAVGTGPESIAIGDFNGDGKADFATVANGSTTVSIRLGNGSGGFTNAADVTVNATPRFIVVGDFNGDNKQDLAVSHDSVNTIAIRLGNGSGGFTSAPDVSVSSGPRCIAIGDFNNDGKQDIVTANIGFGTLSLRLGDGAGNFTGFTATSEIVVDVNPDFLAVGDFNGDGKQDFAVVHFTTANIAAIRLNNSCPPPNTPPTITAAGPLTRQQAAPAINSQIATVNDVDQSENTLTVTATPLTGTGVTVSNIIVAANGNVTAHVAAACAATNSTFTLTVTDNQSATATATLTVNVTLETTPPTLTCPSNIVRSNDPGQCSAVVTFTTPTASDNCPGATVACNPATGSTFAKGTTTVTCTATDAAGNTGSCTFTVTVNDTQAPAIICPSNITQGADAGQCSAVVSYTTPTATDNCAGVGTVSCLPGSGSTFPKGTTTVTCSVTDSSGNNGSCTFIVAVNDTQAPTIACPANITKSTDLNQCSAVTTYTTPAATDNCPGVGAVTCTPASGSTFPKGTTTVTCTATDASGNNGSCSFTVTVNDTQGPTITCPANVTRANDPGQCSAVVTFANATATDNCPSVGSATCSPVSGSTFPKGTTTVTCTVSDASGNNASCTFSVTVNDTQPPSITCPANITISTDPNQCAAATTYATPTVSDNCPGVGSPTCSPASGTLFTKGVTTVTCAVSDQSGNSSSCSFTVTVNDTQAPAITCPANITKSADPNLCTAVTTYTTTATDNCPGVGTPNCSPASGTAFPKGLTTVTCTVGDAAGNSASCSFTVTVNDTQAPALSNCPANITKPTDANVCSAVTTYTNPTASDNCAGVGTPTCSPASGATFPKGVTTVTCSVTDASGNSASCSFTVTVNDTQSPSITCPANITVASAPGQCSTTVNYPAPTVSDNCPGVGSPTCSPASGSSFPKGTTTVTCAVSDAAGNSSSCSFTVTVNDTQPPVITCPANITVPAAANLCSSVVSFTVTASDNCPGVTVVASPASGSVFPKGTTTVTAMATDASGNTSTCSFTVTVVDTQAPTIVCPADVTAVPPTLGAPCVNVSYPAPVVTDNCPGTTVVCSPASGSCFPIGTATVTCTATDASGNSATCSFTVTTFDLCVQDDTNPAMVVLVNTTTGDYRFCCGGQVYTGRGTVTVKGNLVTVEHNLTTRRVLIKVDRGTKSGTASYASPPGSVLCQMRDTNITNNSCLCQ